MTTTSPTIIIQDTVTELRAAGRTVRIRRTETGKHEVSMRGARSTLWTSYHAAESDARRRLFQQAAIADGLVAAPGSDLIFAV